MSKKRHTKKEKMLVRLKRQLAQQQSKLKITTEELEVSPKISYPAVASMPTTKIKQTKEEPTPLKNIYFYDPALIKKDLTKTLILSLIFTGIILFLYWFLEKGGQNLLSSIKLPL